MAIVEITTTSGPFTGYTLAQLRALVLRMLRQSNTTRFSPTAGTADYDWIDDALNRGQDDFVRATKCLRTYSIFQLKANQRIYRLPKDFLDVMTAYFYDATDTNGYKELTFTTIEELNDEISDWRTDTGTPKRIYIDRYHGNGGTFGVYPIPDVDGTSPVYVATNGSAEEWVCPIYVYNKDYVEVNLESGTNLYILPTGGTVTLEAKPSDHNLLMEYYRLPTTLQAQDSDTSQICEIPRENCKALAYYAVADLLRNNPEDSAEYKRAQDYQTMFSAEVATYISKRKRALSGRNLRARPAAWSWMTKMTFNQVM